MFRPHLLSKPIRYLIILGMITATLTLLGFSAPLAETTDLYSKEGQPIIPSLAAGTDFSVSERLKLVGWGNHPYSAVIDSTAGYAYFGNGVRVDGESTTVVMVCLL